ncbi:MAG: tRNA lysidine(34) synthetase TilS [Bacteroidetes bacterium]|nr:tRNA lysidine(34) synthetase TilS [Bacteroidota bacterium]
MNKRKSLSEKFIEFNTSKRLANRKKKTLLAVSGGIDSVVMCDLFREVKFPFAIAHCDFQLRGKESDADEKFVLDLAKKYSVEFFVKKFDTKNYAEEKNISIQQAARELRYTWFEELRKEKEFNLLATAHHLNDNIETIFFNLTKGTGIKGLRGIPIRNGNIIRPLLFASREEIENYQQENKLEFREDSSNADDKYTRNKIRHQIIPLLKEINPSLENTFAEKIELYTQLEMMYEKQIKKSAALLFLPLGNDIYIPILKLKKTQNAHNVLYEYLKDFDFNAEQVEDILAAVDVDAGKQFLSSSARIIKDRRFFILTKLADKDSSVQFIHGEEKEVKFKDKLLVITPTTAVKITADKNSAFLDKTKLEFPLILRPWKAGDYFYPFGMKLKKKKLKKFFTDEKIPLNEKENIFVLESNKKIVWVVGYRTDERFKITAVTKDVLQLRIKSL